MLGADKTIKNDAGRTPIVEALYNKKANVFEELWDKGEEPLPTDALHHTAKCGNNLILRYLLEKEFVALDKQDEHGNTALHYACAEGHVSTVSLLLNEGADVRKKNSNGKTALELAEATEQAKALRVLFEKSGNVELGN